MTITVLATVTSNAYRDTKVQAPVGGIVRQVSVELGSAVRHGQPFATIFSAELADAQMKYLSMRAMLEADHQKRVRTEKLLALGAVSRQEREEVTAVHAVHDSHGSRARRRHRRHPLDQSGAGGGRCPGAVRRHRSQHGVGDR